MLTNEAAEVAGPDQETDGDGEHRHAADGSAAEDGETGPSVSSTGTRTDRRSALRTVLLGLLAAILVAGALVAGLRWNEAARDEERGRQAVASARDMAVSLVTIDSATADDDVRRILDGSVGDFGKIFSENMKSYVDIVRKGGVSTSGEAVSAGLQRIDDSTARVLVAVKATVTNKQAPKGEKRTYRMSLEMTEQPDGRWLAKKVEFVP